MKNSFYGFFPLKNYTQYTVISEKITTGAYLKKPFLFKTHQNPCNAI